MTSNTIMVDRIKQRMTEVGINAKQLAEKADVGKSFVYDILNGKSKNPTSNKLISISKHLGIPLSYIMDAEENIIDMRNYISVSDFADNVSGPSILLRSSFFKNAGKDNQYCSFDINDDSMEPTFHSNDMIIVDTSKKQNGQSGFFLIKDNFSTTVRRVEHIIGSTKIRVIADHSKYATYEQEMDRIVLIGRVVWYLRTM